MPNAVIERLQSERAEVLTSVASITSAIENRDLSTAEQEIVTRSQTRVTEIDAQLTPLLALEDQRASASTLTRTIRSANHRPDVERRSIGDQFTGSDQFRTYSMTGAVEFRALPTDLTDIASILPKPTVQVDVTPPIASPLLEELRAVPVSSNSIEVVTWTKASGAAAVVPEGGTKPLVEFTPGVVTKTLDTIAAATQLTRQMMEDAPAVASTINGYLSRELVIKGESEAAAALVAATITNVTNADLLKGIRIAIGQLQSVGFRPTAALLNPADWADLDIAVMGLTTQGPNAGASFWGLRPIAAASQPAGTVTVGDFPAAVQRYVRQGTRILVSDSHANTFLDNVFTILAENRQKTIVTRPQALREVTKS